MNTKAQKTAELYRRKIEKYDSSYRERPCEYSFVFEHLADMPKVESILDVGSRMTRFPKDLDECGFTVMAIDKTAGNPHWVVIQDDITDTKLSPDVIKVDCVTAVSVLEHIPDWQAAVRNMWKLTRPGGYMLLTFPYSEQTRHPNIYLHKDAGYGKNVDFICRVFNRDDLDTMPGDIIAQEYWQIFTGQMWTFGQRLPQPKLVSVEDLHQLTCILIQKGAER